MEDLVSGLVGKGEKGEIGRWVPLPFVEGTPLVPLLGGDFSPAVVMDAKEPRDSKDVQTEKPSVSSTTVAVWQTDRGIFLSWETGFSGRDQIDTTPRTSLACCFLHV
jgi:hypothetical protein